MPNWCENSVKFQHSDTSQINRIIEAVKTKTLFNEFVPVTNDEDARIKWGTKWDVYGPTEPTKLSDNEVSFYFHSAWSPPIEFYREMTTKGFLVHAYYYEVGMCICGKYTTEDDDKDYYIEHYSSEWVEKNIPKDINEELCISENIAELESEYE